MTDTNNSNKRTLYDITEDTALRIFNLWHRAHPSTISDDLKQDGYANVPAPRDMFTALNKRLKTVECMPTKCQICGDLLSEVGVPSECHLDHGVCIHCSSLVICGQCDNAFCIVCASCSVCGAHQCDTNTADCCEDCTDLTVDNKRE